MRMIDADALKTKMLDYYSYSWQLREEIGDFFDNAPVVLEFDEEITKVVVRGEEYCKKPQWIPVSERLPEEGRYVLCSQDNGDVGEGKKLSDGAWYICYDQVCRGDYWVKAWMPLPEPYKEEEE